MFRIYRKIRELEVVRWWNRRTVVAESSFYE
jgi:hypothetical protein